MFFGLGCKWKEIFVYFVRKFLLLAIWANAACLRRWWLKNALEFECLAGYDRPLAREAARLRHPEIIWEDAAPPAPDDAPRAEPYGSVPLRAAE